MKSLKEIKSLTLEDLERIASEGSSNSPEGFEGECESLIDRAEKASKILAYIKKVRRRIYFATGAAAAIITVLGIGMMIKKSPALPKDTYDDPLLAYIEVSKTLEMLADNMNKGINSVSISRELLEKPVGIINEKIKTTDKTIVK